ncbi:class III lanthionine synthetase LanKC [Streptomyces sp. 769]|uniref:class III lanthionine synthetase LanKC n=1 Tax=Streptomyces sp. 769 TaxID=1262452 RepID=UPI00057DD832|nr:class III lanthionine synthetase LanKC [Streptomyces sp. 769]
MDKRYEVYCLADRYFYEMPDRIPSGHTVLGAVRRPVPDGWQAHRSGDWFHLAPDDSARPLQGWKVHVSATTDSAEKTATDVWDYCTPRGIPFKFVPSPRLLHLRNSKYAARNASGKFATLYPADEEQLRTVLTELHAIVGGRPGPYILTDLRWHEGPLYVRYGAFARRYCVDKHGTLVNAIEDDEGHLVPDERRPVFQVPAWVALPAFLEPHLAARNATTVGELPYRIETVLHFSNGGGVYRGTDTRDGRQVVLKEARPYAGLAADGADAVARLERERAALERLSGLGVAPEVRDWFALGDHRFLVMDFLDGRTLNSFFAERLPLLAADPAPTAVADYTTWALRMHRAVEEATEAVHARGLAFNDLHMFNIMVAPDERSVSLIDFEAAAPATGRGRQVVAHPGYFAPPDRTGTEVDRYALACLRLALFLPLTTLLAIDRDKAAHLAELITEHFPDVPREFLDEAVAEITRTANHPPAPASCGLPKPGDWPRSRDSMVRAILASATPDRDDRLFPGDVAQFSDGGGLGLAHGAAGVLYALAEAGAERYEAGERWLLDHTDPVPPGTPLGLYDGMAGIALALDRLGHTQRCLDLTEALLGEKWQRLPSDLHGGVAGIGLLLSHLARTTGERHFHEQADEAARILADRLTQAPPGRRAGLMRGDTGPALFFLRLYERTSNPHLLELAGVALRSDLARCVRTGNGSLAVGEGRRTLPYLGDGSIGIGAVLDDYLAHTPASEAIALAEARSGILAAAQTPFCVQPGLLRGRAGMIWHLGRTTAPGATPAALRAQVAALDWYSMNYAGELAFPGDQMMRLSMDLATGTAGCLLALATTLGDRPAQLPFLPPLRALRSRHRVPAEP